MPTASRADRAVRDWMDGHDPEYVPGLTAEDLAGKRPRRTLSSGGTSLLIAEGSDPAGRRQFLMLNQAKLTPWGAEDITVNAHARAAQRVLRLRGIAPTNFRTEIDGRWYRFWADGEPVPANGADTQ